MPQDNKIFFNQQWKEFSMVTAFDVKQTREYSLKSDTGENPTKFLIGVLDSRLSCFLYDKTRVFEVNSNGASSPATQVSIDLMQEKFNIVRFGLKGWSGFKDSSGVEVLFKTKPEDVHKVGIRQSATPECMDMIKPFISELAEQIVLDDTFSKAEEKN
jgi:hypothetical protein